LFIICCINVFIILSKIYLFVYAKFKKQTVACFLETLQLTNIFTALPKTLFCLAHPIPVFCLDWSARYTLVLYLYLYFVGSCFRTTSMISECIWCCLLMRWEFYALITTAVLSLFMSIILLFSCVCHLFTDWNCVNCSFCNLCGKNFPQKPAYGD